MSKPEKYAEYHPLSMVINQLEKWDYDKLAEEVIDVFALATGDDLEANNLLAKLYLDVRNLEKCEKYTLKTLDLCKLPQEKFSVRANLAKMYNNFNVPAKSLYYSKQNLAVQPGNPDVLLEMVFSHYLLGEKDTAHQILLDLKSKAHLLDQHHQDVVNFNMGTYDMEAGHFLQGLGGFLINVKKLELWFSTKELPYKYWDGGAFPGKTLILFMEGGGIGDEFITIRWMEDLKKLGFNPVYYTCREDLYEIFTRCGYDCTMSHEGFDPENTIWTYAMQVPLWLKVEPETICRGRYLHPSDEARKKWSFIQENKKLKVGVRWQGNSKNERDLHRRVPLDVIMKTLKETFKDRDVSFYSLQIGDGSEETSKYPELIDLTKDILSYDDTFALIENLDLVVSSCTSVVHASAIIGTKTMVLVPISAYFCWLSPPTEGRDNNTSIWYEDNVRVFKQTKPKDWSGPLEEMKQYIQENILK